MSSITLYELLNQLTVALKDHTDEPRVWARLLLAKHSGLEANDLIAVNRLDLAPQAILASLANDLKRVQADEPLAYVLGSAFFFGLEFELGPGVLIPRPDSEVLVEEALEYARAEDVTDVLELCLGSGCLSIALLATLRSEGKEIRALATEISDAAIRFAERNRERYGLEDSLEIAQVDIFPKLDRKFDLLISNPPYIDDADMAELDNSVHAYEPTLALHGGTDGLAFYRRIYQKAADYLKPGALVICEHGYAQREAITDIILDTGLYEQIRYRDDYAGRARVILCRYKK